MFARKTVVTLWLLWIAGTALSLILPAILPERFYFDAQTVRDILSDPWPEGTDSYLSTAQAYRALGFPGLWPDALVGPVSFTLAFAAVALGAQLARAPWRPAVFLLLASWTLPIVIFHGTYSKEVFAILAIAAMLRVSTSPRGVLVGVAIALLYAVVFRNYWAIIVALWLTMLAGWRLGFGWPGMLMLAALAILPMSWASEYLFGTYLSDGRSIIVDTRDFDFDSATTFYNRLTNTSPLTDLVNTVLGWLTLILPFYLAAMGALQHVAFALFQFVNTVWFARAARRLPRLRAEGNDDRQAWRMASAATWCVAYTIVQGMFEPDFGSFVKHEANLVPMLMYLLAYRHSTDASRAMHRQVESHA